MKCESIITGYHAVKTTTSEDLLDMLSIHGAKYVFTEGQLPVLLQRSS